MQSMAKKKVYSKKNELLEKSREAMLSAVQIYNNPNIQFKSETFVVLAIIAWTYLLHAYYHSNHIDYRYYSLTGSGRKRYDKTKRGAYKYWELERCINCDDSPVEGAIAANLRFLIGIRHEIEHQMTSNIDDAISGRFQACCLNYNETIVKLFGDSYDITENLSFSLQFSSISEPQIKLLSDVKGLPVHIASYIKDFDSEIPDEIYNDPKFSYRVLFVQKNAGRKGQADKVVEFVSPDSQLSKDINSVLIKEREKVKYLPKAIVEMMRQEGYARFNMHEFVTCWKEANAKNDSKYGVQVAGDKWYWYEAFIPVVREYCIKKYSV